MTATSVAAEDSMRDGFGVSTGELARRLGVREITIQNLVRYQLVPRPALLGGRRLWSAGEVERVRAVLVKRGVIEADGARGRS